MSAWTNCRKLLRCVNLKAHGRDQFGDFGPRLGRTVDDISLPKVKTGFGNLSVFPTCKKVVMLFEPTSITFSQHLM